MDDFLEKGIQTDGSSVELHEIATLNNAKVDLLPDLDVNGVSEGGVHYDIYEYSKSPTISQYMYLKRIDDINQMKEYISNCIEQYNKKDKDIHSLSIVYNEKVIGEIALFWIISEKYQNQGFAYEAALAYIDYIKIDEIDYICFASEKENPLIYVICNDILLKVLSHLIRSLSLVVLGLRPIAHRKTASRRLVLP